MESDQHIRDAVDMWDRLHEQSGFLLRYPNEHVVRFLATNFPEETRVDSRVLDIGVGGGRHVKLLCDMGLQASGVDISSVGIEHCREWLAASGQSADLKVGMMSDLPFPDESFEGAISFGVFYYGLETDFREAVRDMHRVLVPGGRGLAVVRSVADYRYGKGQRLEPDTFRLDIDETNEKGSVMHFLSEEDVPRMFEPFSEVHFERTETTLNDRQRLDSDWIIRVKK